MLLVKLAKSVKRQYRRTAHLNTTHRRRQAFYALPSAHWQMLAAPPFSLLDHFSRVDDAIDTNANIADAIVETGLTSFALPATPSSHDPLNWHDTATPSDVNKAHSTIRQFYRDWSLEGAAEREVCYEPVRRALGAEFGPQPNANEAARVLVPGAGLGRLVFDLCQDGFDAEGNEISYHQLLASNWILNHATGVQQHVLHPFALHFANLHSREQQIRHVLIPDIHPGTAIMEHFRASSTDKRFGTMSMSASDFTVSYRNASNQATFDAVATVFFIDTAPNLIRYLEAIHNCLKPNGIWINVGPLLWHFDEGKGAQVQPQSQGSGIAEPGSVELTSDEVRLLIDRMGFTIEDYQSDGGGCGYIQDAHSMLQNVYRPVYWTARKKQIFQ